MPRGICTKKSSAVLTTRKRLPRMRIDAQAKPIGMTIMAERSENCTVLCNADWNFVESHVVRKWANVKSCQAMVDVQRGETATMKMAVSGNTAVRTPYTAMNAAPPRDR